MRKFLSTLLALAMLLSMVPMVSVSAEGETVWTKVASLADISESDTFAITVTVGGNTYVLPVVAAGKAAESTAVPEITGTVSGDTLTVSNTEYTFGWNLVAADGGYYIKSDSYYLFVAASNNGIRIAKKNPDSTFVWNILDCGLLGASEGTSYRTLCVDNTLSAPQWSTYPTANKGSDGQANSKVRDNVLGLWKLNTAPSHTCEDIDPKDHNCDICGTALSVCADEDPKDHNCDVCGTALFVCADEDPKDHNCDVCGTALSVCADEDPKNHNCDVCGTALSVCADEDPKDHNCDICGIALSVCADEDPKDHNCDICGAVVSTCSDADGDGNHNCDICGKEDITEHSDDPVDGDHICDECANYQFGHVDTDEDKFCDDCKAPLCGEDHLDLPGDNDHKCDRCDVDNVTVCEDTPNDGDHNCDECGNENITECVDSDTDADHNCDDCGKEGMNGCVDSDSDTDHNCDICGKENITDCVDSNTDTDHNCDVCGKENITDCVDSDTDTDHNCDVCGKEDVTEHTWNDATYEAPKTCPVCGKTEGEPLPKPVAPEGAHWQKVDSLSAIGGEDLLAITITIDGITYILPNAYVADDASAPGTDLLGTVTADGLYMTVGDSADPSGYSWNVVAVDGGHHIKSGSNFLWMDAKNKGVRITETDTPSVWKVLSCNFLGASDPAGAERTLCVRDGLWQSFKTSGGNAHSSVRSNELGLWKYVPDDNPSGGEGGEGGTPEPDIPAPEGAYWKKVNSLAEIGTGGKLAIAVTVNGVTYLLPTSPVYNSKSNPGTYIHGVISDDGNVLTVDEAYGMAQYSWTVAAAGDGYQIRSDSNYLWLDSVDNGLRISASNNPTAWNVLKCGLLGAADPASAYRVACIRDGVWKSFKTTGGTAEGNAHSSVRGNVLSLWKYVSDEEDPDQHICVDAAGDGDHNCDECGNAGASSCYDKPGDGDHTCDECGKVGIGQCGDKTGDYDHRCDECGSYGVTKCKDKDTDWDHKCDECFADGISPHIWLDATFEKPQTCSVCGKTEGEPLTEAPDPEGNHWLKVESLEEIGDGNRFAITISIDGTTYVLPNATVSNSKSAPGLDHQATLSSDRRYMTIGDGSANADYNWTLIAADGGYYICAGDSYLWIAAGNTGIRITQTDAPTVWNVLTCGLLGGPDGNGEYRVLCIRDNLWQSFKTVGSTATGNSHSTVRGNILGLWKYVVLEPEECETCTDAADDGDHICDVCSKENVSECADTDNDHLCDDCGSILSECADAAADGDHTCDICGKENLTACADADEDNICDDCGIALAQENTEPEDSRNPLWWIILLIVTAVIGIAIITLIKKKKH